MRKPDQLVRRFAQPAVADISAESALVLEHTVQGGSRKLQRIQQALGGKFCLVEMGVDIAPCQAEHRRTRRCAGPAAQARLFAKGGDQHVGAGSHGTIRLGRAHRRQILAEGGQMIENHPRQWRSVLDNAAMNRIRIGQYRFHQCARHE